MGDKIVISEGCEKNISVDRSPPSDAFFAKRREGLLEYNNWMTDIPLGMG